jgi:hypothetical protein
MWFVLWYVMSEVLIVSPTRFQVLWEMPCASHFFVVNFLRAKQTMRAFLGTAVLAKVTKCPAKFNALFLSLLNLLSTSKKETFLFFQNTEQNITASFNLLLTFSNPLAASHIFRCLCTRQKETLFSSLERIKTSCEM